jgi:PAS domain S-box-containing protein
MNQRYAHDGSAQEVEERFELLAAAATEYALLMIDPEGRLLCWNPGAEGLFGYRPDEVIGQHFSVFFSPEDVRNGQAEHELKTARSDGRADSVRWQLRKDGTGFWCQGTMTPLLDANKQLRGFARMMHDLTGSRLQAAETKRADDLAAANRSKEEFMALLSHELRNPLSPILNALNVLCHVTTDNPIIQQAGNIIERQVG